MVLRTSETSPVCLVYLVGLVYLVDLVHLVYPVSLVQPNKQDKPNNQINETDQTDETDQINKAGRRIFQEPATVISVFFCLDNGVHVRHCGRHCLRKDGKYLQHRPFHWPGMSGIMLMVIVAARHTNHN